MLEKLKDKGHYVLMNKIIHFMQFHIEVGASWLSIVTISAANIL
jgi:hypothetical protein